MRPLALGLEFNTFTVIGRCEKTGAIGVCLASSPLTVASRCPYFRGGVAAVSSQCFTNPLLGPLILDLLEQGFSPQQTIEVLRIKDEHFEYRQIGIVTPSGETAVHSGQNGKSFTGHVTGDGFVCMGNNLVGRQVVEEMAKAFRAGRDELLEHRLITALEAGSKAGGEPKGQLSSGIMVGDNTQRRPRTDLRVEMANPQPEDGGDAVRDLRRVVDAFIPMIRYYQVWHNTPGMENWRDWKPTPPVSNPT